MKEFSFAFLVRRTLLSFTQLFLLQITNFVSSALPFVSSNSPMWEQVNNSAKLRCLPVLTQNFLVGCIKVWKFEMLISCTNKSWTCFAPGSQWNEIQTAIYMAHKVNNVLFIITDFLHSKMRLSHINVIMTVFPIMNEQLKLLDNKTHFSLWLLFHGTTYCCILGTLAKPCRIISFSSLPIILFCFKMLQKVHSQFYGISFWSRVMHLEATE